MIFDKIVFDPSSVNVVRVYFEGLGVCGCGEELGLYKCQDKELMDTFYVECTNKSCRMSVGRQYDSTNKRMRGEFTDEKSAVDAANLAVRHGWCIYE